MQKPMPVWRIWMLASRPATLSAAVVPVIVGSGYMIHEKKLRPALTLVALIASCLIQIGTNFANDLFDFRKGADTKDRQGPMRVVQAGLLHPRQILKGMLVVFSLAVVLGAYLVWIAGPWVMLIGTLSIASGILYTAGPYPLAYNGLGDIFVFLFFGIAGVCGTIFVQQGFLPPLAIWISLPVGGLSTAILVVNNIRDEVTDRAAGKRTLVVRLGRVFGLYEYKSLLLLSYLCPLILCLSRKLSPWGLLPWLTLPIGFSLLQQLSSKTGKELNPVLAGTGRLLLIFGCLWAFGIAVG